MGEHAFFRDLLKVHRRIEQLVTGLEVESDPASVRPMIDELLTLLAPHMAAEDEIILPALQEWVDDEDDRVMLHESSMDHEEIWRLAQRLQREPPGSDGTRAAARALDKFLSAHITEEENEIMVLARRILPYKEFARVTKEVQERQAELMAYARRRLAASVTVEPGTLYREMVEKTEGGD